MQETKSLNELKIVGIVSIIFITIVILMNIFNTYNMYKTHKIILEIYDHPFSVSNAALNVQKGVLTIHKAIKNVVVTTSQEELKRLIDKVDNEEKSVYNNLKIIETDVLKDKGKQLHSLFKEWQSIRNEVIQNMDDGNFVAAIEIIEKYVQKLEKASIGLNYYALDEANSLKKNVHQSFKRFQYLNIIFSIIIIIVFIFIFTYIRRRMLKFMQAISQHEKELSFLYERIDVAITGTNDGLWDWNLEDNSVYFSPRWKEMLGYKDDELKNEFSVWEERIHPDDLQKIMKTIEEAHTNPDFEYRNTHRLRHKDGSWVWILNRGKTIFNEDGKAVRMVGFHTDITEQKKLEKKLQDKDEIMMAQSRHAAMGEMISMIAHQWRQPISAIAMDANNILLDVELESMNVESLRDISTDIINQTQELSKTIDDFKDYFKPDREIEDTTIEDIVHAMLNVVEKSLENNNIEVIFDNNKSRRIKTFSREVMQVFINIVKNAKEAYLEQDIETKQIFINVLEEKGMYFITFKDNAGGIDKDILAKIFDPYFTTKGQKNGTGLGLYMSKSIIEKHLGGGIRAYNEDGGACFEIKLPVNLEKVVRSDAG